MHYKKEGQASQPLSSDPTASPNTAWHKEQLEIHGIELVQDPVVIPPEKTDEQKVSELVTAKTRELAVEELKKEGKLDQSGNIPKEIKP